MENKNMKKKKKQATGSGSSFTADLFGPKDSSSSTGHFGSVFGPPSTGLGRNPSQPGTIRHDGNPKYANQGFNSEYVNPRGKNESVTPAEPCYFSSSIYYGGQEVYSPNTNSSSVSHYASKKDDGSNDPNGNDSNGGASRGNWWQGSLYY